MLHNQKDQIREENKFHKIQTSEAGKKSKAQQNLEEKKEKSSTLTVTSVAKEKQYIKSYLKTDI